MTERGWRAGKGVGSFMYRTVPKILFIYIPRKELRGLSPNSYIHVSVSDLYIPMIGPHIWLQQDRQTDLGNI